MTKEEVHDILVRARNILAKRGLSKGLYENKEGNVCFFGALSLAVTNEADSNYVHRNNRRILEEYLDTAFDLTEHYTSCSFVAMFNDADYTKLSDVLALYDIAIAKTAPEPRYSDLEDLEVQVPEYVYP